MSRIVWGILHLGKCMNREEMEDYTYNLIILSVHERFGLYFNRYDLEKPIEESHDKYAIVFDITDNFFTDCCDYFLAEILYNENGKIIDNKTSEDCTKIQLLCDAILQHECVERLELFVSNNECLLEDYSRFTVSKNSVGDYLYQKYLDESGNVPCVVLDIV